MVISLGWSSNYMCWVVPWLGSLDYYLEVVGDLHHLRKMQNSFLDDDIRYISPKNPIKQKGETAKIKLLKDGAWISRVYNYPGCPFEIFHKPWKKGARNLKPSSTLMECPSRVLNIAQVIDFTLASQTPPKKATPSFDVDRLKRFIMGPGIVVEV